mgnify:CR=1 FL=1
MNMTRVDVLVLGLGPAGASAAAQAARQGCTVIMTTHILEVAERMAERIGVISRGRLIAEGTLEELRKQSGSSNTSLEDVFLTLVAEQEPTQ